MTFININNIATTDTNRSAYFSTNSVNIASEILDLKRQNAVLRGEKAMLTAQLSIHLCNPTCEIEYRDITIDQAKKEILEFLKKNDRVYYSEISNKLKIDIQDVVKVCEELEKNGLIEGV
ncbi:MarR family transcriptional regulator [candidate division KSB1 bacterium]|nr:MarR family transcriptional regulator [candidate division KSB1 bacterium]